MKKYLFITLILFTSLINAQKKEIKKAEKLFETGDVNGAAEILKINTNLLSRLTKKFYYRKYILRQKLIR